jgi:hypothetical protein
MVVALKNEFESLQGVSFYKEKKHYLLMYTWSRLSRFQLNFFRFKTSPYPITLNQGNLLHRKNATGAYHNLSAQTTVEIIGKKLATLYQYAFTRLTMYNRSIRFIWL